MRGYNSVELIGNITKDVECKASNGGTKYASFSVAVNQPWKDKVTGEKKESVTFINIMAFGQLAEIAGAYLKKGSPVFIRGSLQIKDGTDNMGAVRSFTSVRASELIMLPGGNANNAPRQASTEQLNQYFPTANTTGQGYGAGEYANRPMPTSYQGNTSSAPESLSKEFMGIDPSLDFQFGANVQNNEPLPWDLNG